MKKSLVLVGILAAAGMVASAKSYDIALSSPTVAGNVQLAPGDYHLKVKGNNATFTDQNNDKSYTVPVKVAQQPQKFDVTAVDTQNQSGTNHIQAIELGGSNTKIEFTD